MVELDESLIYQTKRRPRSDSVLTPEQVVAINLFWRRNVKAAILARVFNVSKNTIYYKCLTGDAPSYPRGLLANTANDTNDLVERLGVDEAWRRYVTPAMVRRVNAEMAKEVKARDDARAARVA